MLHQPCRRDFVLGFESGVAGNLESFGFGALGQVFELRLVEHGLLEKRSGAATIVVSRDNQHAFASSYFAYRLAGFGKRWRCLLFSKVFLQIGIRQTWSEAPLQPEVHPQDNVPSTLRGVKDAGAITESARWFGQNHNAVFF